MSFRKLIKRLKENNINVYLEGYYWTCYYNGKVLHRCRSDTELEAFYFNLKEHILWLYTSEYMRYYSKERSIFKAINKFNKYNKEIYENKVK